MNEMVKWKKNEQRFSNAPPAEWSIESPQDWLLCGKSSGFERGYAVPDGAFLNGLCKISVLWTSGADGKTFVVPLKGAR